MLLTLSSLNYLFLLFSLTLNESQSLFLLGPLDELCIALILQQDVYQKTVWYSLF